MRIKDGKFVIISPHCDDAVLSSFAVIKRAKRAEVIVVCDGVPDIDGVTNYDAFTGAESSVTRAKERVTEDERILAELGAVRHGLGFLDSQYPQQRSGDDALVQRLESHLRKIEMDAVIVPAAIGTHEDHLWARNAALKASTRLDIPVLAYGDIPYASYYGWPAWVTGASSQANLNLDVYYSEAIKSLVGWSAGDPTVVQLSDLEMEQKDTAMRGYETQFSAMEGGPSGWLTHPSRIGFELLWPLTRVA